jgi:hypothetical protein
MQGNTATRMPLRVEPFHEKDVLAALDLAQIRAPATARYGTLLWILSQRSGITA